MFDADVVDLVRAMARQIPDMGICSRSQSDREDNGHGAFVDANAGGYPAEGSRHRRLPRGYEIETFVLHAHDDFLDQHAHDPFARRDGRPFRMPGALDVGAEPQQRLPLTLAYTAGKRSAERIEFVLKASLLLQAFVPTPLELARDQPVVGIDGVILPSSVRSLEARLLERQLDLSALLGVLSSSRLESRQGRFDAERPDALDDLGGDCGVDAKTALGPVIDGSGPAVIAHATGVARSTIGRGLKDLASPERLPAGRVRRAGGGRKSLTKTDPTLLSDLEALVEPDSRGDPMSPLRWTCRSLRALASQLGEFGHKVSHTVVDELPKTKGFGLHANRKTKEGSDHPDRDGQFAVINQATKAALADRRPVISVDTKKKELVGDFKNAGREWRPNGDFEAVRVHDFLIKELGRAVAYGVYDPAANEGWVSVGVDNDTAAFAVQTIRP